MNTRRSFLTGGLGALGAGAAGLLTARSAQAASPIYMKNLSTINLSITTTNPASSGHIYSVRLGSAATGMGFYAPAGRTTVYWLPNQTVKTARAGYWCYPAYSNQQYSVRVV